MKCKFVKSMHKSLKLMAERTSCNGKSPNPSPRLKIFAEILWHGAYRATFYENTLNGQGNAMNDCWFTRTITFSTWTFVRTLGVLQAGATFS